MKILGLEWYDGDKACITVQYRAWWFFKIITKSYFGSGTVWNETETGKRASTIKESCLADVWALARFKRECSG